MKLPSKRFSGYDHVLQDSWQLLWQRPLVFFPIIYRMLGYLVIGSLVLLVAWLVIGPDALTTDFSSASKIAFLGGLALLLIMFEFHVKSVQAVIFSRAAGDRKVVLKDAFRKSWPLYGKVAGTTALFLLAATVVFGIVAGLILMSTALVNEKAWVPLLLVIIGLIALGGFLLALFFSAWMVFWMPVIGYTKKGVVQVLRQCWELLWKDSRHVWITYLIKLGISIGIGVALAVVSTMMTGLTGSNPLWWTTIHFVANAILATWMTLFSFQSFFRRYQPKVV